MNDKTPNDDILFDRLVDGELSEAERRALLESLDTRPQGWRHCALAFLEAQSWRGDLRQLLEKPQAFMTETKSSAPTAPPRRTTTMWSAAQWLAVAAGLLVAFKFGSLQHGPALPIAAVPAPTNEQLANTPTAPGPVTPDATKPADALNLWVRDDAGNMRRVRVPLVDEGSLDPELGLQFQTGVPDDVRDRLEDQGYAVKSQRKFAPMWLDNGRQMIVPVEDTKIVPVSNKVY